LPGYPGELPAGGLRILVEEELLQGQGFEAYQTDGDLPDGARKGHRAGWMELRAISERDLKEALSRDAATTETNNHSDAALSPQEDLK
jgi:hypothetical protein